jgi:CRISPR type IV-associated protein Csf2
MRGLLRDLVHSNLCQALGFGEDGNGLTLPAFHFLFSGGGLNAASNGLDIDYYKRLRNLLPTVSVFGGGVGNALLPGKLCCGALILVCAENAGRLPEMYRESAATGQSCWTFLQEEMNTRKDDSKNPQRQSLLTAMDRLMLEESERAKKAKRDAGDDVAGATGAATQMMYTTETLIAGSIFSWRLVLRDVTDVEFEAFMVALAELAKHPYLGGKSGTGHGQVQMEMPDWRELGVALAPTDSAVASPLGRLYSEHLKANAASIRQVLREMK